MPPLQGLTLGERQKYYNQLVTEATEQKSIDLLKINYDENDVDNMMKIDIACYHRNIDFILEVFKCEDMLYVSRAIKKSTWLITENQYAYIINPRYLHRELFPHMNAKAVTKLMLHIRRYLKDEVRVIAFYKYVKEQNQIAAYHWLENCSIRFIESDLRLTRSMPDKLLIRLCRKSIVILRAYVRAVKSWRYEGEIANIYENTRHFLKHPETAQEFLDIVKSTRGLNFMKFNKKYTGLILKFCPEAVMNNFEELGGSIDLPTFANFLSNSVDNEMRNFLMNKFSHSFRTFDNLSPFLAKLPREETLDFLRALYGINYEASQNTDENKHANEKSDLEAFFYAIEDGKELSDLYRWYQFVPFDLAFRDLKRFIYAESSTAERHSMLIVLLTCASYDFRHVQTVLQYYHDKHINEPYLHKIKFIDYLLLQHETYRFDDETWNTLNILFHSLEVYIESGNYVQQCIKTIIVRNLLRGEAVNKVVEQKFEITTLMEIKGKLNTDEQNKVFKYLYDLLVSKLRDQGTHSETGMHEAIRLVKTIWQLLNDWDKVEEHYRFVIDKIIELGVNNSNSPWVKEAMTRRRKRRKKNPATPWLVSRRRNVSEPYIDISSLFAMVKSYRKELFESSLLLHASEEACINALKHDPGLLSRHKEKTDALRCNDDVSLHKFLSKLRIYWPDCLAKEWIETNKSLLQNFSSYRSLIRGILTLLPRNGVLKFIEDSKPNENKIHWSETDETALSIKKHIAKNMHIARPLLPPEAVLWYARGDYLQYAVLSLNSLYYNIKSSDSSKHIDMMLNSPVSLQKHGIRLVFSKYKTHEIVKLSTMVWNKTRNSSIRTVVFKSLFKLLCTEKKVNIIKVIWEALDTFIDDLNEHDNKAIFKSFFKIDEVPTSVIGELYEKVYLFLKSLPPKVNVEDIFDRVRIHAIECIEYLNEDFVERTLLSSGDAVLNDVDLLTAYILRSNDANAQIEKYNRLLHPVVEACASKWNDGDKHLLKELNSFLKNICSEGEGKTAAVEMSGRILTEIESNLPLEGNHIFIRRWQICHKYLESTLENANNFDELAATCAGYIAKDEKLFFSTIYTFYNQLVKDVFRYFDIDETNSLKIVYKMLEWKQTSVYLFALYMLPDNSWADTVNNLKVKIKRKIYVHPSKEISMHYFRKYSDGYSNEDDDDSDESDSDQDGDDSGDESDDDSGDDSQTSGSDDDSRHDALNSLSATKNGSIAERFCIVM